MKNGCAIGRRCRYGQLDVLPGCFPSKLDLPAGGCQFPKDNLQRRGQPTLLRTCLNSILRLLQSTVFQPMFGGRVSAQPHFPLTRLCKRLPPLQSLIEFLNRLPAEASPKMPQTGIINFTRLLLTWCRTLNSFSDTGSVDDASRPVLARPTT